MPGAVALLRARSRGSRPGSSAVRAAEAEPAEAGPGAAAPPGRADNPYWDPSFVPPDPRAEDWPEDSGLWAALLREASPPLRAVLHGVRGMGARLVPRQQGGHRIAPVIGEDGWESQEAWLAARERWLLPHVRELTSLLGALVCGPDGQPIIVERCPACGGSAWERRRGRWACAGCGRG